MSRALGRGLLRRGIRAATAGVFALLVGALGLACPARELTIEISDAGLSIFNVACGNNDLSCKKIEKQELCDSTFSCTWKSGICDLRQPCSRDQSPPYDPDPVRFKAIRVALVRSDPLGLEVTSQCKALVRSTSKKCGLTVKRNKEDQLHCTTLAVNEAVSRAIGTGLGFDGFDDPSKVFPIIALYQPREQDVPAECARDAADDLKACREMVLPCPDDEIVACAGLGVPVNQQSYDLTCASCQDGLHFSLGRDNGPCPLVGGRCFFETCAGLLARALPR